MFSPEILIYIYIFYAATANISQGVYASDLLAWGFIVFQSKTLNIFMIFFDENAKGKYAMQCNARIKYG